MLTTLKAIDQNLLYFFNQGLPHSAFLNNIALALDFSGDSGFIWIMLCSFYLLKKEKIYRDFGFWGLLNLLAVSIFQGLILKNLIARPRPFFVLENIFTFKVLPQTYSFPSGHTASAIAIAVFFWLLLPKIRLKYPVLLLAILISFSRIYLGVHYPSDVLAGGLIGLFFAWLFWFLYLKVQKKLKN